MEKLAKLGQRNPFATPPAHLGVSMEGEDVQNLAQGLAHVQELRQLRRHPRLILTGHR
jgi:hypothetical protein